MRLWMLRTPDYKLLGPMREDEAQALIDSRTLAAQTELCPSDGDWFQLEEHELLKKYFNLSQLAVVLDLSSQERTVETQRPADSPFAVHLSPVAAASESPTVRATETPETPVPQKRPWILLVALGLMIWFYLLLK